MIILRQQKKRNLTRQRVFIPDYEEEKVSRVQFLEAGGRSHGEDREIKLFK